MAEAEESLEINKSSFKASEECNREEISYLTSRVEELQQEIATKAEIIERQGESCKEKDESRSEVVCLLESQLKERVALAEASEDSLQQIIHDKESIIISLEDQLKLLTSSDQGAQQLIQSKQTEISSLQGFLDQKTETLKSVQLEMEKLQSTHFKDAENFQKCEAETKSVVESLRYNMQLKENLQSELQSTIKDQAAIIERQEASSIQDHQQIESLKLQINSKTETIHEMENMHVQKIAELNESLKENFQLKSALEIDIVTKDQMHKQTEISLNENFNNLKRKYDATEAELNDWKANANDKDGTVNKLNQQIKELLEKLNAMVEGNLAAKNADEAKTIQDNANFEKAIEILNGNHEILVKELRENENKLKLILGVRLFK